MTSACVVTTWSGRLQPVYLSTACCVVRYRTSSSPHVPSVIVSAPPPTSPPVWDKVTWSACHSGLFHASFRHFIGVFCGGIGGDRSYLAMTLRLFTKPASDVAIASTAETVKAHVPVMHCDVGVLVCVAWQQGLSGVRGWGAWVHLMTGPTVRSWYPTSLLSADRLNVLNVTVLSGC